MFKVTLKNNFKTVLLAGCVVALGMPTSANSQVLRQSWQFKAQNRASIASLMKQVEDSDKVSSTTSAATPSVTNLVCGGDGESSARANATCVILNNSDGSIELTQGAEGDQTASNSISGAEEVLDLLD